MYVSFPYYRTIEVAKAITRAVAVAVENATVFELESTTTPFMLGSSPLVSFEILTFGSSIAGFPSATHELFFTKFR